MEYSQNATLVFISAYAIYVFLGKIRTPHALHSGTLLLRNNDTAVDTFVSTAVYLIWSRCKNFRFANPVFSRLSGLFSNILLLVHWLMRFLLPIDSIYAIIKA